jgi:hypothetical protein
MPSLDSFSTFGMCRMGMCEFFMDSSMAKGVPLQAQSSM